MRIFLNGVRIFSNGVRIFQNGVSIFHSSLLSTYSYQSSAKKNVVATDNHLSSSPFGAKVARVARFFARIIYARVIYNPCSTREG